MRSYAASGLGAGDRIVSTYNAGPFVAGAALGAFDRLGLCHIPIGTGNTERVVAAITLLRPTAAVLTPSYAAYIAEWAQERGHDPARHRSSGCWSPGSPAAASRRFARGSSARGAPR